jgi:hypothetical protein
MLKDSGLVVGHITICMGQRKGDAAVEEAVFIHRDDTSVLIFTGCNQERPLP